MKNNKRLFAIILAVCVIMSFAACTASPSTNEPSGSKEPAGDPQGTDNLVIGMVGSVNSIGYPGKSSTGHEYFSGAPAVETLGRYDDAGVIQPFLCESFEADSQALTFTVNLKQGIKFHDGTDLNAEAVKWNWEEFTASGRNELATIESIEVKDEYTVVAHLAQWDNTIADNALYIAGFMVSPTYVKEVGADAAAMNPVGTGPFKFVGGNQTEYVLFEKNEDYWVEGKPHLDSVKIVYFKDATTLTSAMTSGEVQVLYQANGDQTEMFSDFAGVSKISKKVPMGNSFFALFFDCVTETVPTSDINVRKAISHALDAEAIINAAFAGEGEKTMTNQWSPDGSWSWNEETVGYPYDVEKAREALAASAYPDGCTIDFLYAEAMPQGSIAAQIIQAQLAEVGITVNLVPIDQTRSNEVTGIGGNWNGIIFTAARSEVDIAPIYERTFTDDGVRFAGGMLHPDDVVGLIAAAKSAPSFDEKQALSKELSKKVIDDYCMMMPFCNIGSVVFAYDYVADSNIISFHANQWTPEDCYFSK